MNRTQAFLLEIFVKRLDVREKLKEKHKTIGFKVDTGKRDANLFDESLVDASFGKFEDELPTVKKKKTKKPPPSTPEKSKFRYCRRLCRRKCRQVELLWGYFNLSDMKLNVSVGSVAVYFSDFDPLVVEEDDSADFDKDSNTQLDDPVKIEANRKLAKAAGLSPKEYHDRLKNPELKRKKFKNGKSSLFRMTPTTLLHLLKNTRLSVRVVAEEPFFSDLGEAILEFPSHFVEAVVAAAYSSAMREMIAREGHIWWPRFMYREAMLQNVRRGQEVEKKRKQTEITQEEKDYAIRFQNLCEWPLATTDCSICDYGDPCNQQQLTYDDMVCCKGKKCCAKEKKLDDGNVLVKMSKKKKVQKIDKKGQAWLMHDSPEPIAPPPLPISAETIEVFDIVDEARYPSAVVKLFIRLSCFGTALELEPRPNLNVFPL